jgi:hypothetical protein
LLLSIYPQGSEQVLASLNTQSFSGLLANSSRVFQASWNTQDTFSGNYRVVAETRALSGDTTATSELAFSIENSLPVKASVTPDQLSYSAGSAVQLVSLLENTSSNTSLSQTVLQLLVQDTAGNIVYQHQRIIDSLSPKGLQKFVNDFVLDVNANGELSIQLKLFDLQQNVLADANQTASVVPSSQQGLQGVVRANQTYNSISGSEQQCRYSLTKPRNTEVNNATVIYLIINDKGNALKREISNLNIAAGATIEHVISFDNSAFDSGQYICLQQIAVTSNAVNIVSDSAPVALGAAGFLLDFSATADATTVHPVPTISEWSCIILILLILAWVYHYRYLSKRNFK